MSKIGVFVASAGGTTLKIVDVLKEEFEIDEDDIISMEEDFDEIEQFSEYDVLLLGSSTWGQGDVHFSWVDAILEIEDEGLELDGKKVAFFGAGDAKKHGEEFCSALAKLHKTFTNAGASAVGAIPVDGYTFEHSEAQMGDKLCGCAIDEHNEPELTQQRIKLWIETLKKEL